MNPLAVSPALLAKIGSIAGHLDEYVGRTGHPYDLDAAKSLLTDPEVAEWLKAMRELALVPQPRRPV